MSTTQLKDSQESNANSDKQTPDNHIGVRELKNQLTRVVNTVRHDQKEYIVTVHGEPVAVLRPYTEADATAAWEEAFDREMAEMLETAKRLGDITRGTGKSAVAELEKMREESACR